MLYVIALLIGLLLPLSAYAIDATHTHRLLPQDNRQFVGDAINFMQYEDANTSSNIFTMIPSLDGFDLFPMHTTNSGFILAALILAVNGMLR